MEKGHRPVFENRWQSLERCLISLRGNLTGDAVRSGRLRGKLIFRFASNSDHPIAKLAINKFKATWGFEVFYGKGLPSIVGEYPGDEPYRLEGTLTDAPGWLIEGITVKAKARRQATPKPSKGKPHDNGFTDHADPMAVFDEEKPEPGDLDALKGVLGELSAELGKTTIAWRRKETADNRVILVGRCPFEHDSGESDDGDLRAGFHDDGPYVHCLHGSCTTVKDVDSRLKAKYGGRPGSPFMQRAWDDDDDAQGQVGDVETGTTANPQNGLPEIEVTKDRHATGWKQSRRGSRP